VQSLGLHSPKPGDNSVYFTSYFSNANTSGAPDATVRVINDGDTGGSLYAAYYVFDDSQELSECGACYISADGINSESVNKNLTSNPLTGRFLHVGVIKLISSSSSDPTASTPRLDCVRGEPTSRPLLRRPGL
jgi:hypothetical protein